MSSLASRSLVLALARVMNQGLMMLSPILLVRLLDVEEYGRYRQFTVLAMFLIAIAGFSIAGNINYFVARSPRDGATYLTNSCLLLLGTTAIVAGVVALAHAWIVPGEIAEYWLLLVLYVPLYVNLDLVTSYWLANKRSDAVLYYSLGQVVVRLGAVVVSAFVFRSVGMIFLTMVVLEAAKTFGLYVWLRQRRLLLFRWDWPVMREQLRFVVPFGSGTLLYNVNDNFGKLVVGGSLGPAPLAIYSIAAYQVPILTILKSALSEAIFPDMVQRSSTNALDGLKLWQRTNVLYFLAVCPVWILLTYYAEPVIRLLFTDAYAGATPYFQVLLLVMVRQCFDFSTPLRSVGHTMPFVTANVVGLALNALLTFLLMPTYGLWGPTVGVVVCHVWLMVYLGSVTALRYGIPVKELLEWSKLLRIMLASFLGLPLFAVTDRFGHGSLIAVAAGVLAYVMVYSAAVWLLRIDEVRYVARVLRRSRVSP